MKASHVALFSALGMTVVGLAVYMLTPPRPTPATPPAPPSAAPSEATPFHPNEPPPRPTLETPQASVTTLPNVPSSVDSEPRSVKRPTRPKKMGTLHLYTDGDDCDYYVDGKQVGMTSGIILFVELGPHTVTCKRSSSGTKTQRVDVAEEGINPVFF